MATVVASSNDLKILPNFRVLLRQSTGCTHLQCICNPGGPNAQRYMNGKGFYSINMHVCCDATSSIRSVVAWWPGGVPDARIFHVSNLKQCFEDDTIPGILLGDNGYPCLHYLLTPLLNPWTPSEWHYNRPHNTTRGIIERTFGIF